MPTNLGQALHTLVAGFFRRTWLFGLVAIVICVAFAASATSSLLEASYFGPPEKGASLPSSAPVAVVAPDKRAKRDGAELVARNVFCSTCTPSPAQPGATESFTPNCTLIATSVGDEPTATVRVPASEVQGSYSVGDTIFGIGKVERIGWRSIDIVDSEGRRGRVNLLDQQLAAVAPSGTAIPSAAADPFAGRIRKIDAHTFEVDRDLVKDLVSGAAKPGQMRIMPLPDGKGGINGLKLSGVRGSTIGAQVGLQNGDTLVAINNVKIENLNSLLDVYSKIDTLNTVELGGTRGDKPVDLTLRLK